MPKPSSPKPEEPPRDWKHFALYERVRKAICATPAYFKLLIGFSQCKRKLQALIRLEGLQPGCQRRASLPDLLRADQPERRILREPFRVVHVFVSRQSAVDGLPQQVSQRQSNVLAPRIGQVLFDEFTEAQTFVQLPNQDQAAIQSHP